MSDFPQHLNFSRHERRRLLTMYMDQYNQANSQIDRLYDTLDEIRTNINTLIGNNTNNNYNNNNYNNNNYNTNNNNTNNNTNNRNNYNNYNNNNNNMNRNRRSNTFNHTTGFPFNNNYRNRSGRGPYIYYDYNNPINPSTYLDNPTNNNNEEEITNLLTSFLNSTVVIRPTEEQINNASRLVRYSEILNPNSATCAISLDPFVASDMVRQIHQCGHIFFPEQFTQWFHSNVRCPVCRYDIRNYRSNVQENIVPNNSPLTPQIPLPVDEEKESEPEHENHVDRNLFSNFNTIRNPVTNDIEHVTFDISGNEIVDNLLSSITDRFVTGLFSPISTNSINSANNDRFVYDPSNNILLYETIIRRDNN